jgi:hypothetical protein
MKIRANPLFPNDTKQLSRELGILWRELATMVNSSIAETVSSGGRNRNGQGVDTTDDVIIDDSDAGLVLKSPDGDYWRIQVTNLGVLTITNLGATKP